MSDENCAKPSDVALISKAVARAARRLGILEQDLAMISGVSNLENGAIPVQGDWNSFENATLFLRVHDLLDTFASGDAAVAASWLNSHNTVLEGIPIKLIRTNVGLRNVLDYLQSRRNL
ncbi:antitoxin Xre/MbcA/ParS toxin-binding domain-containing protein [Microvirga splendida]|uniref:DUF2384 domain-containing protein n=1 Tax=Microvirga splendida TaxID=2795727 RepID=A0ABS0Y3K8_9HYPH|nr:DUF2384 domain-containing protein [Microvirga splendida]